MTKIYIPSNSPEDWQGLLADPEKQWRTGFSAKATAYSWQLSDGFPSEINELFSKSTFTIFKNVELLLAIPEHKVSLPPTKGHPSQNDVFAIGKALDNSLISITVEAKVSESFDRTVSEWIIDSTHGKIERIEFLKLKLQLHNAEINHIRYQLLHRLASAVLEAERFSAKHAIMIVQSFSKNDDWFEDFTDLLTLYNTEAAIGKLVKLFVFEDISVYAGWVKGNIKYLAE